LPIPIHSSPATSAVSVGYAALRFLFEVQVRVWVSGLANVICDTAATSYHRWHAQPATALPRLSFLFFAAQIRRFRFWVSIWALDHRGTGRLQQRHCRSSATSLSLSLSPDWVRVSGFWVSGEWLSSSEMGEMRASGQGSEKAK